jgi:hypothetical protein
MTSRRTPPSLAAAATALAAALLSGCGTTADTHAEQPSSTRQDGNGGSPSTSSSTPAPSTLTRNSSTQEADMQVQIQIGQEQLTATIDDTPAGRDLMTQLPQTIEMSDHGGVEKTGPLRAALNLDGQPDGADPDVGELGYYAPGNDLVLYYGDQYYYAGIVVLGRLDDTAATRLAAMDGDITATITAAPAGAS